VSPDLAVALALPAAAAAMFVIVGLSMSAALPLTRVITSDEALAGFSDAGLFNGTPFGAPTLVMVPGSSSFGDFVRLGVPFAPLVLLVTALLVPLVLPPQ
jgi:di/tricarboxylate transporter